MINSKDITFGEFENNLFKLYDCNESDNDGSSLEQKIERYNSSMLQLHHSIRSDEEQLEEMKIDVKFMSTLDRNMISYPMKFQN